MEPPYWTPMTTRGVWFVSSPRPDPSSCPDVQERFPFLTSTLFRARTVCPAYTERWDALPA